MDINKQPKFIFGIPLRAKALSDDWDLVCKNLERTLSSLSQQKDKDFIVYIAAHEHPPVNFQNLTVKVLLATHTPDINKMGGDKGRKKQMIGASLREDGYESVYFMHLDADDLVDPSLVEFVQRDDNKRGYLLTRGYIYDVMNDRISKSKAFYKHCGSCAILYFTRDDFPLNIKDKNCYYSQFGRHKQYKDVALQFGRELQPLKKPMVVYMVNHGENTRKYRGKGQAKVNFVKKHQITDNNRLASIKVRFPDINGLNKSISKQE
jgi:hypothetical protein